MNIPSTITVRLYQDIAEQNQTQQLIANIMQGCPAFYTKYGCCEDLLLPQASDFSLGLFIQGLSSVLSLCCTYNQSSSNIFRTKLLPRKCMVPVSLQRYTLLPQRFAIDQQGECRTIDELESLFLSFIASYVFYLQTAYVLEKQWQVQSKTR
jgi:hypothetical protein